MQRHALRRRVHLHRVVAERARGRWTRIIPRTVGFPLHPIVAKRARRRVHTPYGNQVEQGVCRRVSILTRPWGRVQRGLENARERFPKRKCSSCQGVPCRALGG